MARSMWRAGVAILYVTSTRIQSRMAPDGRDMLDGLCHLTDVIPYGPGFPGFRGDNIPEAISRCPYPIGLVVIDEATLLETLSGFRITSLADVALPKAQFVVDYWSDVAQRRDFCRRNRVGVLIARYEAAMPVLRTFGVPHVVHCPHTVNPEEIPSTTIERGYDIVISGAMTGSFYPFRARLCQLLTGIRDLRVLHVAHPGYRDLAELPADAPVGKRYCAALASARIGIATSGVCRIPFRKYLEIAACRTIVAGDMPLLGIEALRPHIVRLDPGMSDGEIVSALRGGLERFDATPVEREELAKEILSHYGQEAVARRLLGDLARCVGHPT